jgi:hypothetical protein
MKKIEELGMCHCRLMAATLKVHNRDTIWTPYLFGTTYVCSFR